MYVFINYLFVQEHKKYENYNLFLDLKSILIANFYLLASICLTFIFIWEAFEQWLKFNQSNFKFVEIILLGTK